ncbi:hypothetical protein Tco_0530353 [Tanacetum coccineum]
MENVGLTFAQVSSKAHREGVGLRVADSLTGNYPEGGFTPFETIRRLLVVIGRRSLSGFKGDTFKPRRRKLMAVNTLCGPFSEVSLIWLSAGCSWIDFSKKVCEINITNLIPKSVLVSGAGRDTILSLLKTPLSPQLLLDENKLDSKSFRDK